MNSDLQNQFKKMLYAIAIITLIGIVMVYSSSYIYTKEIYSNSAYYFLKQLAFVFLGVICAVLLRKVKSAFWIKRGLEIHLAIAFLVFLTLIPGVGITVKGSSRWLSFIFLTFQPGELMKLSTVFAATSFFYNLDIMDVKKRILSGAILFCPLFLFLFQPDFGTFSICFILIVFVCFLSDFPRKYFYILLSSSLVVTFFLLILQSYRIRRLLSFLDPWKNAKGSGFQIIQSYLALANGAFWGQGLGNSNEKLFYLPEAHNDFIFSVIGEELGFVGIFCMVSLYFFVTYQGLKISLRLRDKKDFLLFSSCVFLISFQTVLNMGVILGLLPTKGLNLPFVSYGGSSLITNFIILGVFSSIIYSRNIVSRKDYF